MLRELKRRSRTEHKTMGQLVSELLAPVVGEPAREPDQPLRWISRPMGALVDLEDKDALSRALGE